MALDIENFDHRFEQQIKEINRLGDMQFELIKELLEAIKGNCIKIDKEVAEQKILTREVKKRGRPKKLVTAI